MKMSLDFHQKFLGHSAHTLHLAFTNNNMQMIHIPFGIR